MTTLVKRSAGRARDILKDSGIPYSDDIPLTASTRQFSAGGHYGVEIPAINSFKQLEATIRLLKSEGVYCTRFDETHGSFLLSDSEVKEMLAICKEHRYGFLFGIGPRPEYDVKASFYRTPFGLEMGRQLNNHDAFAQAVDEALRLCELGCRGLTIYDIGLLKVLSELRNKKYLPSEVVFKTSSHCMPTNAPLAQLFADCGANSITTAHDLGIAVLHEMHRYAPEVILDIPTDVYKSKGGYIRWFELSEMVQVASPMFLKMGASVQEHPYDSIKPEAALDRVKRVAVGLQYLESALPSQYKKIDAKDRFCCLPAGSIRARLEAAS